MRTLIIVLALVLSGCQVAPFHWGQGGWGGVASDPRANPDTPCKMIIPANYPTCGPVYAYDHKTGKAYAKNVDPWDLYGHIYLGDPEHNCMLYRLWVEIPDEYRHLSLIETIPITQANYRNKVKPLGGDANAFDTYEARSKSWLTCIQRVPCSNCGLEDKTYHLDNLGRPRNPKDAKKRY